MNIGRAIVQKLIKGYRRSREEEEPIKIIRRVEIEEGPKTQPIFEKSVGVVQKPVEVVQRPVNVVQKTPVETAQRPITIIQTQFGAPIEIPKIPHRVDKLLTLHGGEPLVEKNLNLTYPLIPRKPAKDEKVFAYAKIFWDDKENRYMYQVVEPELSNKLKNILEKIRELLEQRLDVDFSKLKKFEASNYLKKEVDEILKYFGFITTGEERDILKYYIERDFIGLGKLEPIMRDTDIEDVSCDGIGIPIFVFHRNPDIGSIITNISFDKEEELDSFINRLAQLSGKTISVAEPLMDGMLPDGSRLQLTLETDIARRGSNFSGKRILCVSILLVEVLLLQPSAASQHYLNPDKGFNPLS